MYEQDALLQPDAERIDSRMSAISAEGADAVVGGNASAALAERKRKQMEAMGKDEEEEKLWMEIAKDKILEAPSLTDMFDTAAEYIDDEWLGDIDELPGNIYRIVALGTLTENLGKDADPLVTLMKIVRILGFISIFLVQLFGPPLLLAAVTCGWGIDLGEDGDKYIHWRWWTPTLHDYEMYSTTKLLSSLFLFIFPINGLYVLLEEKQSQYKIYQTFRYLKHNTPNMDVHGSHYLIVGALVNSWVVVVTTFASFQILGGGRAPSPRGLLFDALGLLFLYNLDDLDSDLGFVSLDDWDGVRLGWVFRHMVKTNFQRDNGTTSEKFDPDKDDWTGWMINKSYEFVAALLVIAAVVMPVCGFFTPWSLIIPDEAPGFE
jgi:hypothetical protein